MPGDATSTTMETIGPLAEKFLDYIMPRDPGPLGSGLGYACILLQSHLGLGVTMMLFPKALTLAPDFARRINQQTWEATFWTVAGMVKPAPVIIAFALIQALGGATDLATWIGLLLATFSVLLGAFAVVFATIFGGSVPDVNVDTGDIITDDNSGGRLSITARVVSGLRAFGQVLLIFGAPPIGVQLIFASLFVRLALAIHAVGSMSHALKLQRVGHVWEALLDAEYVVRVAPIIAGLALLDQTFWGEGTLMFAPLQPTLYCALACCAQVGLVFTVQRTLGVRLDVEFAGPKAEFDVMFDLEEEADTPVGARVEAVRSVTTFGFHAALTVGLAKAWIGVLSLSPSADGLCMTWPNAIGFTAVSMMSALVMVLVAEYAYARYKNSNSTKVTTSKHNNSTNNSDNNHENGHAHDTEEAPETEETPEAAEDGGMETNGAAAVAAASVVEPKNGSVTTEASTFFFYLKGMVGNVINIVLALIAVRAMSIGEAEGDEFSVTSLMWLPCRYGFVFSGVALFLRMTTYLIYSALHIGDEAPPPFDEFGVLDWQPSGQAGLHVSKSIRRLTLCFLHGGFFLGLIGMGVLFWAVSVATLGPLLFCLLPPKAKSVVVSLATTIFLTPFKAVSSINAQMEEARAAKAAKLAASLEESLTSEVSPRKPREKLAEGSRENGGAERMQPVKKPKGAAKGAAKGQPKKKNKKS